MAPSGPGRRRAWDAQPPPEAEVVGISEMLERVQTHVYKRRLRVRDVFLDHDQLRCGRCTRQQFVRGVDALVSTALSHQEVDALAAHFTEEGPRVHTPQVVNYTKFCRAVDEVFMIPNLEMQPTAKVPRPGSSLQRGFAPSAVDDEERLSKVLRHAALLAKTRGVEFGNCFQDCERSNATSLVCSRHSGKVTPAQFKQHFPFAQDFSEGDLDLLIKRYRTEGGDVHFQAMHRDLREVEAAELMLPTPRPRQPPLSARSAATPAGGGGWLPPGGGGGGRRPGRRPRDDRRGAPSPPPRETPGGVPALEKIQAIAVERRLRILDGFQDFDRLRKGVCTANQVRTACTILRIPLEPEDYDALLELYGDEAGMFRYRDFAADVNKAFPSTDARYTPTATPSGPRIRYKSAMSPDELGGLDELEARIRRRAAVRRLPLKAFFQDFDRTHTGRVTRTQFRRIVDVLSLQLDPDEADVLCQAYCDTDNGQEFCYLDFCASVEQQPPSRGQGIGMEGLITPSPRRPKYFTMAGNVAPLDNYALQVPRPCTR